MMLPPSGLATAVLVPEGLWCLTSWGQACFVVWDRTRARAVVGESGTACLRNALHGFWTWKMSLKRHLLTCLSH